MLGRQDVHEVWLDFTEHDFVKQLGAGKLPLENFKHYLIQDYLFLVTALLFPNSTKLMQIQVEFARAKALAGSKTRTMAGIVKVNLPAITVIIPLLTITHAAFRPRTI